MQMNSSLVWGVSHPSFFKKNNLQYLFDAEGCQIAAMLKSRSIWKDAISMAPQVVRMRGVSVFLKYK